MSDEDESDEVGKTMAQLKLRVKQGELHPAHLEDAEAGYTYPHQVRLLKVLSQTNIERLALMALRWFDSPWTDKDGDLFLGVEDVMGRKSEAEKG